METRAHYVLIGAFVMIAIASVFLFILWIGQSQREYDPYDVIFRARVSGLNIGSPVSFNGIQKGQVSTLTIDPDDPNVVIARIRVDRDTPIKEDTLAKLEYVGFTGAAMIQFVGGSPDLPDLKDTIRGVPRIDADATGIAEIFEGGNDIVVSVKRLLSDENIEAFNSIIASADTFMAAIAEEDESISETLRNVAEASANIARTAERLEKAADSLDRVISESAPGTFAEAEATLREARLLIADLRGIVDENKDPIAIFANQGLAQAGPALAEARRMFRTLDQVLREIDRNPRGYFLGESTPQYEVVE
ncbi:MAG: MlaD family protein [Pseudomonadota bacterium]